MAGSSGKESHLIADHLSSTYHLRSNQPGRIPFSGIGHCIQEIFSTLAFRSSDWPSLFGECARSGEGSAAGRHLPHRLGAFPRWREAMESASPTAKRATATTSVDSAQHAGTLECQPRPARQYVRSGKTEGQHHQRQVFRRPANDGQFRRRMRGRSAAGFTPCPRRKIRWRAFLAVSDRQMRQRLLRV